MTGSVALPSVFTGRSGERSRAPHAAADSQAVRDAMDDRFVALVRIPVCVIVSGFLFSFLGAGEGVAWLAAILLVEGLLAFARSRMAKGDMRYHAMFLACIAGTSVCWVVHALLLWGVRDETAHVATLMDLFTISLYGAISGRNDWRIMVALTTLPLTTLSVLLLHMLWTQQPPIVAAIGSLATFGSCSIIVLLALVMNRATRALTQAHEALALERDSLEARVATRTADLARATVEAQSANIAKSQFLATMSHELRTPLNAIIGYAEILQEDPGDGASQRDDAARIETAGRHLLSMINDVLDLSKIDAGKMEVCATSTDIRALLGRVGATVAHLAKANGTTLAVSVEDDVGLVVIDGRKLFQCIVNLTANACKFTERGEVAIAASLRDGALVVSVKDTGCGIEPDQIAALFEPFRQLDSGDTRKHEGTGLGLAITQRLVRLMGGDIEMVSAPGEGTTVTLKVPCDALGVTKTPDLAHA